MFKNPAFFVKRFPRSERICRPLCSARAVRMLGAARRGAAFDKIVNFIGGTPKNIVNPAAMKVRR